MRIALTALLLGALAAHAQPKNAAEIVSVEGKGEVREAQSSSWKAAANRQPLFPTNFVRTLDMSRMAILFADRTQVRLAQNSVLQIKEAAGADARTTINLNQGRSWTQSKTVPNGLVMETPSALAAIRGTDWEMVVDADGKSTLSVFSGEVELSNPHGRVLVAAREQAQAEKGRAPVKLRLQVSRERIQWVSSFSIDPARHRGETLADAYARLRGMREPGAADALLLADMEIYRGELPAARTVLADAARRFPQDARVDVAQARVALMSDDFAAAMAHARAALARAPDHPEALIVLGDIERRQGRGPEALAAYARATVVAPQDARAWHGLGAAEAERESVRPARAHLLRAIALDPREADSFAELGTLEGFAGKYARGREALQQSLALQPDNYVALTGLGVLELKAGREEAALDALLRATVIEPKYARAQLYLAAAYYQLERDAAALDALARAAEADPNDPLPWLLSSIVHMDRIEPGRAVEEAQQALKRIPYLKSLNQVADNQKGVANVGYPLGFMGLEAWARSAAHDAYLPFWGGSHLFLADRYPGDFNRRSELLQGFITNPLAFGASNRFQSLFLQPGHHATLGTLVAASDDLRAVEPVLTLNGYDNRHVPFAYFVEAIDSRIRPRNTALDMRGQTYTAALGAKPVHELGVFLYANHFSYDADLGRRGETGDHFRFKLPGTRVDVGAHYAPDARSSTWVKAGAGEQDSTLEQLSSIYLGNQAVFGSLAFDYKPRGRDVAARHTVLVRDNVELTVGAEAARTDTSRTLVRDSAFHFENVAVPKERLDQEDRDRSASFHAMGRLGDEALRFELGLAWTRYRSARDLHRVVVGAEDFPSESLERKRVLPLLGVSVQAAPGLRLHAACRRWLRPAGLDTLAPVSVAHMPLDDQLVLAGGLLDQCRGQASWTVTPRTFLSFHVDRSEVRNLVSPIAGVLNANTDVTNVDRLRNRVITPPPKPDLLEDTPVFGEGRVWRANVAWEQMVGTRLGVRVHYTYADSENTHPLGAGLRLPYIARHQANVGLTWAPGWRSYLTVVAVHRGRRFADEANSVALAAGWDAQVTWFKESEDKRWAVELYGSNLLKKELSDVFGANVSWRF